MTQRILPISKPCKTCGKPVVCSSRKSVKDWSCSAWCNSYYKAEGNYEKVNAKLNALEQENIFIEILSFPLTSLKTNKLRIRYTSCQHEEDVQLSNFLKRRKNICVHRECVYNHLWQFMYKTFNGKLIPLTDLNEPKLLDELNVQKRKVLVFHKPCNTFRVVQYRTIFKLNPNVACPICQPKIKIKNNLYNYKQTFPEDWLERNEIIKIEAISKPILVRHKACGFVHYVTLSTIKGNPKYCENCSPTAIKTKEIWNREFVKLGLDYKVIEYTNHRKGIILCLLCNEKFNGGAYYVANDFINCKCRKTKQSKGERFVESILQELRINYQTEVTFSSCRDKHVLPFDFALYEDSTLNKVIALIEYEGIQHFEPIEVFGGEKEFKNQLRRDKIKRTWAKNNAIPLLEIPYTIPQEELQGYIVEFLQGIESIN